MLVYWSFFLVLILNVHASKKDAPDLSVSWEDVPSFHAQVDVALRLFGDSLCVLQNMCSFNAEPLVDDQRLGMGDEGFWAKLEAHSSAAEVLFEAVVQCLCDEGFDLSPLDVPVFKRLMAADIDEAVGMLPPSSTARSYLKMGKLTSYLRLRKLGEYLQDLAQQAESSGGLEIPSIPAWDAPLRLAVSKMLQKNTKFSTTKRFLSTLPTLVGEAFTTDDSDSTAAAGGSEEHNDQALELAAFAIQTIEELEKDFSELVVALYDLIACAQMSQSAQAALLSSKDLVELVVGMLTERMEFAPGELIDHLQGLSGSFQLCWEMRLAHFRVKKDIYRGQVTLRQRLVEVQIEVLGPSATPELSVESLPLGLISLAVLLRYKVGEAERLLLGLVNSIGDAGEDIGYRQPPHHVIGLSADSITKVLELITCTIGIGFCDLKALAAALRELVSLVRDGVRLICSILDFAGLPSPSGSSIFFDLLQGGAARFLIVSQEFLSTLKSHKIALD